MTGPAVTGPAVTETVVLVAAAAGVCALYLRGSRSLPTTAEGSPWAWRAWGWRRWAFCTGVAVLVAVLFPPLDPAIDASFPLHMLQHMLLLFVAAPLLALGASGVPLLLALPRPWRRRTARIRSSAGGRAVRRAVASPALGVAAFALVVFVWHVPPVFTAALESDPVHVAEHASFLAVGWLLWTPLAGINRVLEGGRAVLYLFLSGFPMTIIGAGLTLTPRSLYPAQTGTGPGALAAQQVAGSIMWVPSGFLTLGICLAAMLAWLMSMERSAPAGAPLPPPVPPVPPQGRVPVAARRAEGRARR